MVPIGSKWIEILEAFWYWMALQNPITEYHVLFVINVNHSKYKSNSLLVYFIKLTKTNETRKVHTLIMYITVNTVIA